MIVLLTDFGTSDPYVGQMKGSLITHAPDCRIVDLTHDVPPYGLTQAAFFLDASYKHFPEGSLFLTVVDPGVGGPRRIVCLEADSMLFLAPDNGVLSLVLEADSEAIAYNLSQPFMAKAASATFHGRDIFAPLAAQLCAGDSPECLGPVLSLDSLTRMEWSTPQVNENHMVAHCLHVDHFGNVITNLRIENFKSQLKGSLEVRTGVTRLPLQRVRAYCDIERGSVGLIAGSQGFFELAMNMGSASDLLSLAPGEAFNLHLENAS